MTEITRKITMTVKLEIEQVCKVLRDAVVAPDDAVVTVDEYEGAQIVWTVEVTS